MDSSLELGSGQIGRLMLKFSLPSIIGMLVNAMYSVVDRIFVGRGVGSMALSGVAVTFPISNVIMAFGMLVGIGSAAVVSIKLGQGKTEDAQKIVGNAFILTIIFSIALSIVGIIFLEPILNAFGASPETLPYAKQFSVIILAGAVLQNIGFGLNPIMRAEGAPKMAMTTMLIGSILNFIINPLLIFGLKFGVRGSALATVISQTVCTVWILFFFTKGRSSLKIQFRNIRLEKQFVKEIVAIGMSPFAMQIASSIVTVVFNKTLEQYGGDISIAAFSLINSIVVLILMPIFGINQGVQPIIGYNYGAKNPARVRKAYLYSLIIETCIATAGFITVQLFPEQIIRVFNTSDPKLVAVGANGLVIFLKMLAFVGVQISISNYYQSVGKAKHSMLLSLLRQIILLIPLVLILPYFFGLNGVWLAGAISDVSSSVISAAFVVHEMRNLKRFSMKQVSRETE